ncbi:MAG: trypsin-like peptidase domain-containing protein [Patescibacteria group bacterium]
MEDLTKSQLVLLFILISIVVSFSTAIVTATLFQQAPSSVTNTIQRVVEKTVGGGDQKNTDNKETIRIVTEEERVIEVVKNVSPAVVSIVASKDLPIVEQCYSSPFGDNDPLNQFFPEFVVPQLCKRGTEKRQVSAGSGFIVRDNGMIVTNKHVVEDKEADYTVIMNNGKKYSAKVLVRDPLEDVALVKIEAQGLPYLSMGDSNSLRSGQRVIAIGNALGEFQNTVSEGIISGLSRTLVASGETLRAVIQTDAAINPGNSGGPLINLEGNVIGVNTAIAAGAQSIGFALPINLIKKDIDSIEKTGKIVYPFLGVRYIMIDEAVKKAKNLSVSEGALVGGGQDGAAVTAGSPAAAAGIREGDIIIEFAGEKVTKSNALGDIIAKHKVGDTVSVKLLRDGKEMTLQLALVERKF